MDALPTFLRPLLTPPPLRSDLSSQRFSKVLEFPWKFPYERCTAASYLIYRTKGGQRQRARCEWRKPVRRVGVRGAGMSPRWGHTTFGEWGTVETGRMHTDKYLTAAVLKCFMRNDLSVT